MGAGMEGGECEGMVEVWREVRQALKKAWREEEGKRDA
jgi:hypothetical protein